MSYGKDTSCLNSLVPGRLVTGTQLVVEAMYRRLITPRGMLGGGDEESAYGLDVSAYLGAYGGDIASAALPQMVNNELLKDDRVSQVRTEALLIEDDPAQLTLRLTIAGTLLEEGEDFEFSVDVTETSATFVGGIN